MRPDGLWSRASWTRILHSYRIASGFWFGSRNVPGCRIRRCGHDLRPDQLGIRRFPDLMSTASIVAKLHCQFGHISAVPESAPIALLRRRSW
jgi:hypothetical protein